MKYLFTAVLSKGEDDRVYARVPDIPGCVTSGRDYADALEMIEDAAAGCLCTMEDHNIPISAPTEQRLIEHDAQDTLAMIRVDTIAYRAETETKAVRKTVSLPGWMVRMADKCNINCSQVLQNALREQLETASLRK